MHIVTHRVGSQHCNICKQMPRGLGGQDLVLYGARRHCGVRLRELAVAAGGLNYGSVAVAVQRFEQRLQNDPLLRRHDETIRNQLLQC